ncbi:MULTISPECIES: hypothetical protein [Thioclava]|uniref:hypothetical protein n=1 Tax=Thioclava TaxID=285107 RepID=UPI0023A8ABF5|nr:MULTISPECIES: hypothetical protein [Thioclava]
MDEIQAVAATQSFRFGLPRDQGYLVHRVLLSLRAKAMIGGGGAQVNLLRGDGPKGI